MVMDNKDKLLFFSATHRDFDMTDVTCLSFLDSPDMLKMFDIFVGFGGLKQSQEDSNTKTLRDVESHKICKDDFTKPQQTQNGKSRHNNQDSEPKC